MTMPPDPQDEMEEIFIQRNVYAPTTLQDFIDEENDKIPVAQREADRRIFLLFFALLFLMFAFRFIKNEIQPLIVSSSRYHGAAGVYQVDGKAKTIRCPDGSLCSYSWTKDPDTGSDMYLIRYPNGFQLKVFPVGMGGGISTYNSEYEEKLTDEIRAGQVDVKNAMLEHEGFTTNISPWRFTAIPLLVLSIFAIFYPYKYGDVGGFLFLLKAQYFQSAPFLRKVQVTGLVGACFSLVILIF